MNGLNSVVLVALISQLGSPDYRTREIATAALAKSMPAAFVELHIVEQSIDREIARRATIMLNSYYSSTAVAKADMLRYTDMPWINETSTLSLEEAQFWLTQARLKIGLRGSPDWQDYRLATRMYVINIYESRGDHNKVTRILSSLLASERLWVTLYGGSYNPPIVNPIAQPKGVNDLPK